MLATLAVHHALDVQNVLDALADWDDVERPIDAYLKQQRRGVPPVSQPFSEAFLMRVMHHPRQFYRLRSAELGRSYPRVMAMALGDRHARIRVVAADSPAAPPHLLAQAAGDTSMVVRRAVAGNPHTPVYAVIGLLDDPEDSVRLAAARHPDLPERVLRQLARHGDDAVRVVAAEHCAPVDVLALLARDPSFAVTLAVAANPSTPGRALELLTERWPTTQHLRTIAVHPNTPAHVLDVVADQADVDIDLWLALASNPTTRSDTLDRVPGGWHHQLHRAIAHHRNASPRLRRRLAAPYLQSDDPKRRGVGLSLVFGGPARVAPRGAGRVTEPTPVFFEPVDVLMWLAEGGDLSLTIDYAHDHTNPAWLRRFLRAQLERTP